MNCTPSTGKFNVQVKVMVYPPITGKVVSRHRKGYVQAQERLCPDTGKVMSRHRKGYVQAQVRLCPGTGKVMSRHRKGYVQVK